MVTRAKWMLGLAGLVAVQGMAWAAPITPGNLVIYRVGAPGGATLGTTATPVFLDEYTTGGALVQSIALPSSGASALTAVGNATTEGIISASQDGTALLFTGYRKDAGGTSPAGDTYVVTNRVVGTVGLSGTPDTSTALTNDNGVTTANTIRSATSVNGAAGSPFWTSTSSRIGYAAGGLGSTGGTVQIDPRNSRQVTLADSVLYASNGSTAVTAKVQSYGVLPTAATAPTPVVSLATADAVNGIFFADVNPGVAGVDVLYLNSTVEGLLRKYVFDGTAWAAAGSITGSGAQNLTGLVSGSTVTLFTTSGTTLSTVTDASGIGGTLSGSLSSLATAGTGTAFRGIGVLVPEPGCALLVAGGALLVGGRRRKG